MCCNLLIILMSNLTGLTWRKILSHNHTNQAPASLQPLPSLITGRSRREHAQVLSKFSHSTDLTVKSLQPPQDLQGQSIPKLRTLLANIYSHKLSHLPTSLSICLLYLCRLNSSVCSHKDYNLLLYVLYDGFILESEEMGRIIKWVDVQFTEDERLRASVFCLFCFF